MKTLEIIFDNAALQTEVDLTSVAPNPELKGKKYKYNPLWKVKGRKKKYPLNKR